MWILSASTERTAIVGESLAGLFVLETFLLEPALFQRYIVLSPSVWWNRNHLLRTAEGPLPGLSGLERTLFVATAKEEIEAGATDTLAVSLKARTLRGLTLYYEPRPDLLHSTIFRAAAPGAFAKVLKP